MQRSSRHLDRCGTMTREKRGLDPADGEAIHPEPKRPKVPALASVIVEALKVDSLQKLCSSLEPVLRRVVSEEVERALAKLGPAKLPGRSSPKQIEGPDGRNLQLQFKSRLSQPLFTGGKVEGEQGAAIHVVLLDTSSGRVITTGPESSAKLDVVVLEGDFNNEDDDDWTEEEFESHVVKEREGKRPLLTGDLQISLKEGVGTLGELTFTDNSSWIRSRKFRLGLKIASGFCESIRVREAKTEAFMVKDHRGELYKKHFPPALKDEVWRLEKIGKDGSFHKRLNKAGIHTVEDFLRIVVRDPQRLRKILGSSMSNKMWEVLVDHAKTCVLSGKHYVYYADNTRSVGAIFNNIYEFTGLIAGGQYYSAESLADGQKVFADSLVKRAYDDWMQVIEYDGKVLLNFKEKKKATASPKESLSGQANYPTSYDQQVYRQLPAITAVDQPTVDAGVLGGVSTEYNGNQLIKYSTHNQHMPSNGHTQFEITSLAPQNQLVSSSPQTQTNKINSMGLVLGPPPQTTIEFQALNPPVLSTNLNSNEDWTPHQRDNQAVDDFFSEEEIRMRSHEILENEDMQHLLRVFSMGGASVIHEDGLGYSSYSPFPNFNFDEDRSRSSGRACAGWLKIKAAMRWGIFIRKKAAERRAQLVEIDD
ncbi:calmodulin-binding protein 60 D-like [Dioscorea cayenensis subsp. rotundata]|uniref:Calmodulin-binding protein 60 D-like n=1 Tax=Dioscorea cayennensis subsp. rotundata TaxID=55577 RepID=A0AB40APZ5_DIOCR|nr:calmodulin-binding protein 60 D-like [Dioscorea cayenensis subsp. rotundata]